MLEPIYVFRYTHGPFQKEWSGSGGKAPAAPAEPAPAGSMLALLKSKGVASAANHAGEPGEVAGCTPSSKTTTGREMCRDEQGVWRSAKEKPTDTTGVVSPRPSLSCAAKNAAAAGSTAKHESVTARPRRHSTFKEAVDPRGRIYYWDA